MMMMMLIIIKEVTKADLTSTILSVTQEWAFEKQQLLVIAPTKANN